jgi:cobalt-zinc-cadmium efflux system outer membrane protein
MRSRGGLILLAGLSFLANEALAQPTPAESMTIDEAVAAALEYNLDLLAARYEVDIATARIVTARLLPNPILSGGADYLDLLGSGFLFNGTNGAGPSEGNVRLDVPIELGGKRRQRIAYAKADRSVSELLLLDAVRELRFAVQSACVRVLLQKALLELAHKDLSIFEGIVTINESRVRDGDLAESELMRTRLAARERANIIRLYELSVRVARLDLQLLLGRDPTEPVVDVIGPAPQDTIEDASYPILRSEALEQRPDLRALAAPELRADADIQLQRALSWIDLNVGVMYHRQYGYAQGADSLGFFLGIPLPFFDRNQGEIQRARQTHEQSVTRTRAFRASVDKQVAEAISEYVTSRELLEAIEGGMTADATEVRDVSEYAYRRGEVSFLEFLDAQRTFNETMRSYRRAKARYSLAYLRIEWVTGRWLEP